MMTYNSPEIGLLLSEVQSELQNILDENLFGLYLYGSLVGGGFVEGISDIDLFALLVNELTEDEFHQLEILHNIFVQHHPIWENRLEIAYLTKHALSTFRTTTNPIAIISPGEPFHIKDAGTDWAINWYILRQQGKVLFGKPVEDVFPKISEQEFIGYVHQQAVEWGDWVVNTRESTRYQAYAVVTLCRALFAVTNGQQPSKQDAADWFVQQYPSYSELVNWALKIRVIDDELVPNPQRSYAEVEAFVQFVINEIEGTENK